MYFPTIRERPTKQEAIQRFLGYNHTYACTGEQFYDMANMSSHNFPALSVRKKRTKLRNFTNLQGMLTTNEHLVWVDNGELYVDSELKSFAEGVTLSENGRKTIAKLNSQIIIYPDKVWYNISDNTSGTIEQRYEHTALTSVDSSTKIRNMAFFTYAKEDGSTRRVYANGKTGWAGDATMGTISTDNTFPLKIQTSGHGDPYYYVVYKPDHEFIQLDVPNTSGDFKFKKGDLVKISLRSADSHLEDLLVNKDGNSVYAWVQIVSVRYYEDDSGSSPVNRARISFRGILPESYIVTNNVITVERIAPDMAFLIESNNRLWGCSQDGHHIYGSQLGDATVWNSLEGISTDAWETTIGSDGEFTGAISYNGSPHFFKEDRLIRLAISSIGAHQTKEILCRGVQKGCASSLVDVSGALIYKSPDCICSYNGAMPIDISKELGDENYSEASAGVVFDKYYISMKHISGEWYIFVYDTKNATWSKEDSIQASFFCNYENDLLFCSNNILNSIVGSSKLSDPPIIEDDIEWYIESAPIGYYTADHKYLKKVNLRVTLDSDATATLYTKYDMGEWEEQYTVNGAGTRLNTLPIMPQRCDHFRWKLIGKGECVIHSVFKTYEEGSDKV